MWWQTLDPAVDENAVILARRRAFVVSPLDQLAQWLLGTR